MQRRKQMDSEELHELIAVQVRDVGLVDGDTACVVTDMILMALHGAGYEIQQKTASSGEILGSDAGSEKVAGGSTREDGRVEGVLVASSGCTPEALVTPATDQRERMQRILDDQLKNQPLPPATDPAPVYPDEPLVVSATGLGLSPAPAPAVCVWQRDPEPVQTEAPAAAPAVCVWTLVYRTSGCGMWKRKCTETPQWCELPIGLMHDGHPCFCGLPISFTEALTKGGMIAAAGDGT